MSYAEPTAEEEEARHLAMSGGCQMIAPGGHCGDISSVVLWHGEYISFNDYSETARHWDTPSAAELFLNEADRERIWMLLVEAGQKLQEIEAIGESWRVRLVQESKATLEDRDPSRHLDRAGRPSGLGIERL